MDPSRNIHYAQSVSLIRAYTLEPGDFTVMWKLKHLIIGLLWLLCPFCGSAATSAISGDSLRTAGTDTVVADLHGDIGEVIVYGERNPAKEIIPSQTLTGKQLENLNAHSVADAVRYFSGVQLKDYGGVGGVKTLDIRSMGSNHMGVYYDGIQLGNAQNGQIDLGKYSLDNIESISLYNGQKSDIFQGAKDFGGSGSIYLTTRRPRFKEGKRTNFNATVRTGSFGLINPSVRIEHSLSSAVSASFNAEYQYATGRYKFRLHRVYPDGTTAWDTTAVRKNGDVHALRLEGAVYSSSPASHWYAKLYYYDSQRGIPGAIVNNVWHTSQRQWDRNFFTQGSWQKRFGAYETRLSAKYARDYMHYLNPDTTLMRIDNRFYQDEVYISSANCLTLMPGWDADLSVDYQFNALAADLTDFSRPRRHTLMAAVATSWRRSHLKVQASLLYTFVADRSHVVNNSVTVARNHSSLGRFTPALYVSLRPWMSEDFHIRAFYKRAFRMPTFNDLYYTDIGNARLKPEYATQYDIGMQWSRTFPGALTRIMISADGYHNRISDKIIAVPKGTGQYRWMMTNIGKVRIWGVDAAAELDISLPADIALHGRVSYTYQRAMDYTDPADNEPPAGSFRGQIAYIPRHSGSASINASWRGVSLNYSFIYVGERYHNSSNIPVNREQPWYTSDMSAGYRFPLSGLTLTALLEVNNLLDQQYEVILNYPMPGRNFRITLKADF